MYVCICTRVNASALHIRNTFRNACLFYGPVILRAGSVGSTSTSASVSEAPCNICELGSIVWAVNSRVAKDWICRLDGEARKAQIIAF